MLFWAAFAAANLVRFFGPRIAPERGPLDEREQMLKAKAGSLSGFALTILAVAGCFYFAFATRAGSWLPTTFFEWLHLGLAIETAALALPVLVASWLQPAPDAED